MPRSKKMLESFALATTGLRVLVALGIAANVSKPNVALALLAVFILWDILDGEWARARSVDSDRRRLADAFVDRISVHVVFLVWFSSVPAGFAFYVPLLIRDVIAGVVGRASYSAANNPLLLLGGNIHKSSSLSNAMLFASLVLGGEWAPVAFGVAWTANLVTLLDYIGAYKLQQLGLIRSNSAHSLQYRVKQLLGIRYLIGSSLRRARLVRSGAVVPTGS